ncbi:unnamed protein product [Adineta steineri]|uniref:Uncharacterized protein n=2 Tax=Adineta steineri TaxID=433720 RepID=A0A814VY06_9BILA|nr:unnamed protein product [Adineta steineri]CAF1460470.1 unnamed protein product [Adineta steineri]
MQTGIEDEHVIKNERRSTRLYLLLLIISIIILAFYYSTASYTQTIIIKSPTLSRYRTLLSYTSLECDCSTIGIKYNEFLSIAPIYHEFCQSKFVFNDWIDYLQILYEQSWNNSDLTDFRRIAFFQFKTLRSFCQLAKETVSNSLELFQQREFVQSKLVFEEQFQAQLNSFIGEFIDSTPKIFLRTLNLIQDMTAQNLLMTGASVSSVLPNILQTTFGDDIIPYSGLMYTFLNGSTCTCSSSTATNCMGPTTVYNDIVSGFQIGCYMLSALLKSTLQPLYNQTWINMISNSSANFEPLNSSMSNSTVETLLSQLFVIQWINTTSYEQYFNNCLPDSCQYSLMEHYSLLNILTLLIGLFGGLSSAFMIISPLIVTKIWPFILKLFIRQRTHVTQSASAEPNATSSSGNSPMGLLSRLKKSLQELNLFKKIPPSQDENILQQERHTTRLYLILFFLALTILILFTSITPQSISVTVPSPSFTDFIQLYAKHSDTLRCPCEQTTIKYRQFISSIKPIYHEICLSDFVSADWINLKYNESSSSKLFTHDFRSQAEYHFQLLSTLCRMANQTIEESLQTFFLTELVTNDVLSQESFQIQIDLIVEQFKRTMPETFQQTVQLIKANLEINQFITPRNTVFYVYSGQTEANLYLDMRSYNWKEKPGCDNIFLEKQECKCYPFSTNECYLSTVIIDDQMEHIPIPGTIQTWFPLQSLFNSTLECFYDAKCLAKITQFINSSVSRTNFTPLELPSSSSLNKQFDYIESLANDLFIRSWNNESSYQSYFDECHPRTCQYTYQRRFHYIYMITTIVGSIGGLNIVLRLLTPIIIKFIYYIWMKILRRQRNVTSDDVTENMSVRLKLGHQFRLIKRHLFELDLFPTIPQSENPIIIRRSRRKTRFYLCFLIIALLILLLYTSLQYDTITVVIKSPSVSQYEELLSQYPRTLKCPCNHIAIKYDKFISQIEPQYHQICTSTFVTSKWFEALKGKDMSRVGDDSDFRKIIGVQFEIISKLCSLSKKTLTVALYAFQETDYFTRHVIPRDEFKVSTEALLKQFETTRGHQFMQIIKLIQAVNHGNQLVSVLSSNWKFILRDVDFSSDEISIDSPSLDVLTLSNTYDEDNCSCAVHSNCSYLSNFDFRTSNQSLKETLPGFRVGCLILDALLQSSFSCLYNKTCLELMRTAIYYSRPIPVQLFTYKTSSELNITIETLLGQLFVLQWVHQTSYESYFNACAPQQCHYSYSTNFNQIYVITTLIAVFGGLTKGLHIVVSGGAWIIIKILDYRKKKRQVTTDIQQSSIIVIDQDNNNIEMTSVVDINQIPVSSTNEETNGYRKQKERAYVVVVSLLLVTMVIIVSIVWVLKRYSEYQTIVSTKRTTTTTISSTLESTSTITDICYMNLKNQFQTYATGDDPKQVITGDFNKDFILDLAVTNCGSDSFSVMLGNGNETFRTQKIYSTGNRTCPAGIATADFNNDTFLDFAITLWTVNQIAIFFGVPTNVSFSSVSYAFSYSFSATKSTEIETADLDGDESFDLVVPNQDSLTSRFPLGIYLNRDNGRRFDSVCGTLCEDWIANGFIISVVISDFDDDGKYNDLSLCGSNNQVVTISSINYTDIEYDPRVAYNTVFANPLSLIRGKFNDDNFDDLALVSPESDTLQILLAVKIGKFSQQIYLTNTHATSVARINFNNDSIDDLVVLHCNGTVAVFLGTKLGLFDQTDILFETNEEGNGQCAQSIKVNDFNRDGRDDLVFVDPETNTVRVRLNLPCTE